MKKRTKIFLSILLLIVLLLASLAVWQWENIRVVCLWLQQDSQAIADRYEQGQKEHHEALVEEFQDAITVKPPSASQSSDLLEGKVSPEQIKEELGLVEVLPQKQKDSQTAEIPKEPSLSLDELVNQCIAELYSCKVDVMAELGVLKQAALDEWIALMPQQRTKAKKMDIITAGLKKCYEKEVQVDSDVKSILDKYREKINQIHADTSVLETLWQQYCQEKENEKAYYLDKYVN